MNTKENKKQYNSLGEMARKGDYLALLEKLLQYEGNEEMKILQNVGKNPYSELDELLFNLPRFAIKQQEKKEKEEQGVDETFLDSLLVDDSILNAIEKQQLQPYFLDVIDVMLRNGANPNTAVVNGITPFMMACTVDNDAFIRKLLDNGYQYQDFSRGFEYFNNKADLDKGDSGGNRPLYYAAMTESVNVMDALINDYNVNPDTQYILSANKTILHLLCVHLTDDVSVDADGLSFKQGDRKTKSKSIDKLIELGVNPTLRDDYDNLAEELVPTVEDIESPENIAPEEIEEWDKIYEKIGNYRKNFTNKKVVKYKAN